MLVTGSAGRVGRAVCHRLRAQHRVMGLDVVPSMTTDVVASVGDASALRAVLRDIEVVVHAAALHAPHVGSVPDQDFWTVNVAATETLVREAAAAGVQRLVYTSTTALYGAGAQAGSAAVWCDEATVPAPATVYHRTKLAAEQVLERLSGRLDLPVTVLRMSRCFPEPAPLTAAYRLHRGIDLRDVTEAHAAAVNGHMSGFRMLVVSGRTPFLREDGSALMRAAPAVLARRCPAIVQAFASRGWTLPASIDRVYDSARAEDELGWRPRFGFQEVLDEFDRGSLEVMPPLQVSRAERASLRFALGLSPCT